ncbi:MAG: filamentous hemagglutinin N-terminal domain-containing protein [Merismopedia sp. SIO2A8]|nr:filamentous hemagglutinin N-terminal domain-containing protein [Merismopedia sp. SIO2A8]
MTLSFGRFSTVSLAIALPCLSFAQAVNAQVKPDQTLGPESSLLTPLDRLNQRVDGGAIRGDYLFHSFENFSIPEDSGVFFSNPDTVDHIFSRVTGTLRSDIFGTLGVLGDADLFFLNPNGVLFGPNARLDIRGSFVVSTGDRFSFVDGSSFSAIDPDAPPLLTMNIAPGVQLGAGRSPLLSEGQLIAGKDLTLNGSVLDLEGWLAAGGDLLLQGDRVQLRDSASASFIAQSGGALTVEGNTIDIFALNHPNSGLISGGDMVFRSSSPVVGDAHYWSGGDFRIETLDGDLGLLSSVDDPVIQTAGDVAFDGYTGASLHVFAGGSVMVPGQIEITGADPDNGVVETVALSNGSTVEINGQTTPTLDVRAGTTAIAPPETIGNTPIFTPTVPATGADITIGSIRNPGGTVFLTNQYQPNLDLPEGTIRVGGIDTSAVGARPAIGQEIAGGGDVVLDARSNINLIGEVNTSAIAMIGSDDPSTGLVLEVTEPGDGAAVATGGTMRLIADGAVITQNLRSSATAGTFVQDDASNDGLSTRAEAIATAGDIVIEAAGAITTNNVVTSAEARAGVDAVSVPNTDLFSDVTAGEIEAVTATATSGEVSFNSQASISANTVTTDAIGNADAFAFVEQDDIKVGTVAGGTIGDMRVTATSGDIQFNAQDSITTNTLSTRAFGDGDAFADVSTTETGFTLGNLVGGTISRISTNTTGGDIAITSQRTTVLGDIRTDATGESRAIAQSIDAIGDVTGGTIGDIAAVMTGGTVSINAQEAITTGDISTGAEAVAVSNTLARDGRADSSGVGGNIAGGTVGNVGAIAIGGQITLNTGGSVTTNELVTTTQADGSTGVSAQNGSGTVVGGSTENVTVSASGGRVHINAGEAVTTEDVITNALGDANSSAFANIDDESANRLTSGQLGHHFVTAMGGAVQVETQSSVMVGDVTTMAQVDMDVSVDATLSTNEDGNATVVATGDFIAGIVGDVVMMAEGGAIALNAQDSITTGDISTRTQIDGVANAYATRTSGNVVAGTVGTISATAHSGDIDFDSQNTLTTQAVTTNAQVTNTVNAEAFSKESGEVASDMRGGTVGSIRTTATAGTVNFEAQNAIRSMALTSSPDLEPPPALDTHAQGETTVEADARLSIDDEDVNRDLYGGSVGTVSTTVEGGDITFSTQNSILTGNITTTSTNQANIDVYTRVLANNATVEGHLNSGIIDTLDTTTTGGQVDFTAQASITTEKVETTAQGETRADADVNVERNTALVGDLTGGTVGTVTTLTEGGAIHLESQAAISTESLTARAEDDTHILTRVRGLGNNIGADSDLSAGNIGNIATTTTGGNIRLQAKDTINTDQTTASAQVNTMANATVRGFRNIGATNMLRGGNIAHIDGMAAGGTIEFETDSSLITGDVTTTVQDNVTAIAYVSANISADVSATIAGGLDPDGVTELQGGTVGPITLTGTGGEIMANAHTGLTTGELTTTTQLNVEPKVFANAEPLAVIRGVNIGRDDLNGGELEDITILGRGGDITASTQASIITGDVTTTADVNVDGNIRNLTIVNGAIYEVPYGSVSEGNIGNVTVSPVAGAVNLTAAAPFVVSQNITTTAQTSIDVPGETTGIQASNGQGGTIALTSTAGLLTLQEGRSLRSNVLAGDGNGGAINLSGQSVDLQNNELTTTVVGAGDAGAIHINANDTATITNSRLLSSREAIAEGLGEGGDIEITGRAITLNDFAFLNTATFGDGNAGHVTLQSTQGDIVLNNSSIFSLTSGSGDGGAIALVSAGNVQLNDNSSINTTVALGATGDGGDIRIDAVGGLLIQGTGVPSTPSVVGTDPQLDEIEPNDGRNILNPDVRLDFVNAQPIDGSFSLANNPDVLFSEEIPFVAIAADSGTSSRDATLDYYSVDVTAVGTQLTFDIDRVVPDDPTKTLNTILRLYDVDGNVLASNDDASEGLGASGSDSSNDA